jgi:hypothetical protein
MDIRKGDFSISKLSRVSKKYTQKRPREINEAYLLVASFKEN